MNARVVLRLSISLALTSAASHTNAAIGDQEFFASCAAVYAALEHVLEGVGDSEGARIASDRFQILGAEVEALFPDTTQGRNDARAVVGDRLQDTLLAALADKYFLHTAKVLCDAGFVEWQGR